MAIPNLEDTATWSIFHAKMCRDCRALCCRLPVEATADDLIGMELLSDFDRQEKPRSLAKQLKKRGLIDHFHAKSGKFTLARRANGDCLFLNEESRRCAMYEKRPATCRNHPQVGPRPGFCPYQRP
ncbi:MAG: YkgJ family cysteine cluster protein [Desulfobulbaceae bacterium]|jgi:Fe-S-cluster containining protein|nr:YkgJ family cysteine cluster protein [Desulfobulbaceae bacterium]